MTLLAGTALSPATAQAQDYPNKPIKLVIPFPAGGSSDGIGRQIADKLSGVLKQTIVVENKGVPGGVIGIDAVANSPSNGYNFLLSSSSASPTKRSLPSSSSRIHSKKNLLYYVLFF